MAWEPETSTARLAALRDALRTAPRGPVIDGSGTTQRLIDELANQIDDYLLPRLANLEAPLLAGIGGSTGAGKSTITNSLVGATVTPSGLLRPTTRTPVLVCHPNDESWFLGGGVLPDLPRVSGTAVTGHGLRIVTVDSMVEGLAILDTPDIDSVEVANHELAAQLLGAADLWIFVTTAARYADAVPWEYLAMAQERAIAVGAVVNRIPTGGEQDVVSHFRQMLEANGLGAIHVFPIPEAVLHDDRIPESHISGIRWWLLDLAADAAKRRKLVRDTIEGALASIPGRVDVIVDGLEHEAAAIATLATTVQQQYSQALATITNRLEHGTLLRQEVLSRWQEYVGGGQLMTALQGGIARLRDGMRSIFVGGSTATAEVQGELRSSLAAAIVDAADAAADRTVDMWERTPGGRFFLGEDARTLARPSPTLRSETERTIAAWQDHVLGLVRQQSEGKRLAARTLSLGINTIGVSLMVVLFAHTGGITGGEVAVAGGTATVSQALLTAIFGENAVRDLARQAHTDLMERIETLLAIESDRFTERLAGGPTAATAETLRGLAGSVAETAS